MQRFTADVMAYCNSSNPQRRSRRLPAGLLVGSCLSTTGPAQVRITEFMAGISGTLADEDGLFEDWIEIQNTSTTNVNLLDWCLTESADNLTK